MEKCGEDGSSRPTRLMITKMILENFKSYAGEQEIGPFHKRFSSIVGPNGSGKSNVIDALLFVFGKRAKQLRLNKVSELIHKSSRFPDLEYARVAVHFQLIHDDESHEDAYEVVPGSEFVVTRTALQNNSSTYTVDGKNSTYTAVGQLLRSHGIDLDNNRFLILQGEVEQIAMMKPKGSSPHEEGLLEYLEDIIGSNKFVEPIAKASEALDHLNERRAAQVNRLKVSERERNALEGAKDEAEAFLLKEMEQRREQNNLYQIYVAESAAAAAEASASLVSATEKLQAERNAYSQSQERLVVVEKEVAEKSAEYEKVKSEVASATAEYTAFERRDVKLQEDMAHNTGQLKKLQTISIKEGKKREDNTRSADAIEKEVVRLRESITAVEQNKEAEEKVLDEVMVSLQDSTAELRSGLEGVQVELIEAQRSVSSLQTEQETVSTALKLASSRSTKATKAIEAAEERLSKVIAEEDKAVSELAASEKQHSEVIARMKGFEEVLQVAGDEEANVSAALSANITKTEEAKASLASESNRSGVIATIMKAARKGGPLAAAGVRGRLGDLGAIDDEYDVAISTACGALDFIVVESTAGAQRCVKFLREQNAGRASFIALDQMGDWAKRMDKKGAQPKDAPRLFDLVRTPDEVVRPAFYMALRDTLVAPNLDSAVAVAYEGGKAKWRVVTLDGNLIDNSGAMSGGGQKVKSGGMRAKAASSSKVDCTPADLRSMETDMANLKQQMQQCREAKAEAEKGIKDCQKRSRALSAQCDKSHVVLVGLRDTKAQLQERISTLRSDASPSTAEMAEMKSLQARHGELEKEMDLRSPKLKSLASKVEKLQKQILEVGGPKLKKVQSKIEALIQEAENLDSLLQSKEVELRSARLSADKADVACTKAEKDANAIEKKLESLKEEQTSMENDVMALLEALDAAKAHMEEQSSNLGEMTSELRTLQAAAEKVKTVELELLTEIDESSQKLKDSDAKCTHWGRQLAELRARHTHDHSELLMVKIKAQRKSAANRVAAAAAAAAQAEAGAIPTTEMEMSPAKIAGAVNTSVEEVSSDTSAAEVLQDLSESDLSELRTAANVEAIKERIEVLEEEKKELKAEVNFAALEEYYVKDADYCARLDDLEKITSERNESRLAFEELRRQRLEKFMAGFGHITLKLKEMYRMITLGGDAELELVDSLDPFSEGIVFSVRPPKKSWKNISNLSGGEKTLSSLALVFALHHFKPTPLYVMDEIDAALDFKNVSIVANYIKDRTKNAQFVIISLRNNMFELADRLVGIYKTNDATKSVTVNPKKFKSLTDLSGAKLQQTQRGVLSDKSNLKI